MNKIEVDSGKMEMLSHELSKLQCWLTGYHAGKGHAPNMVGAGIPGEDAVRQARLLFRDMVQAASAPALAPEASVADEEGWIVHDGKGMPVDGKSLLDIKFRDGDMVESMKAGIYHDHHDSTGSNWIHDGQGWDIIAYRKVLS